MEHKTLSSALMALLISASASLFQTTPAKKLSFDVISIKPNAPTAGPGPRRSGGGARGDRYMMSGPLRMLLQQAYGKASNAGPGGQLQIIGGPSWIDSDEYDIQATANCSGGALGLEQLQQMIQSMLQDRFQLKAHMETRELPVYNLVVSQDGLKIKPSADQTPPPIVTQGPSLPCSPPPASPAPLPPPGQRGGPGDPSFAPPRGTMFTMMSPTSMTIQASSVSVGNLVGMLQNQIGRPVFDKTDLKALYDFKMTFSPEGLELPGLRGIPFGPPPGAAIGGGAVTAAADPLPSLFTAIQEMGLKLESAKGPVDVLLVESVQKPTEN
jgi:uncharacterized protein (TIGR03435 family)